MSTTFISPVARLVQGGMTLQQKKDMKGQPAKDDQGNLIQECFMAIAIPKNDPNVGAFFTLLDTQARASFPHLFPNGGNCTHPKFAWKIQDGDGVDDSGQSVANKPGFAGNWIFKMATRFAPRCFHYGKYDPSQQIQNPDDIIKKGYFIRVSGTIDGNGVQPDNRQAVPGLYVSPNLVELVAFGEEIVSGPDAAKVFGAAPAITALPPGASTTPLIPAAGGATAPSGLQPPGLPGTAAPSLPGASAPALPGDAAPSLPGATAGPLPGAVAPGLPGAGLPALGSPPLPGANVAAPAAPVYQMTASAQGATREQLLAIPGWTDELLIQQGHMIRVA